MDAAATEQRVIRTLSPSETMNRHDPAYPEQYWCAGRSALVSIHTSLSAAHKPAASIRRILDLPCGYGRVLRYLQASFPDAELSACDLLTDAVDFCASTFGATPIYSNPDAAQIPLDDNAFDLIWVGSLVTHLDAHHWSRLLTRLTRSLREGGILVLTAHGRHVYRQLAGLENADTYGLPYWRITRMLYSYEHSGFGYASYRNSQKYGISISDPQWVLSTAAAQKTLRCVHFTERLWHGVQDVYAFVKGPHPSSAPSAIPFARYAKHLVREAWKPSA